MGLKQLTPRWVLTQPMFRRLWTASLALRGRRLERGYDFFDDDIFLVSYPKSGNTWTRFLVANLRYPGETIDLTNIERLVPEIYLNDNAMLKRAPRPRVLKSHDAFNPRFRRVIYIVRDPRDVAVSYFHYSKKMRWVAQDAEYDDYMPEFLDGRLDRFGSWGENIASWLGARRGNDEFLIVRYEDLIADARAALVPITAFLGIQASDETYARALEMSSIDHLRSLEKKQAGDWKMTRFGDRSKSFFRSGASGGWRDELPQAWAERIARDWGAQMTELGYEPS